MFFTKYVTLVIKNKHIYTCLDNTYATSIKVPSFNQDICGRGLPTAAQSSVITDPSKAIVECGLATNSGAFNLLMLSAQFNICYTVNTIREINFLICFN